MTKRALVLVCILLPNAGRAQELGASAQVSLTATRQSTGSDRSYALGGGLALEIYRPGGLRRLTAAFTPESSRAPGRQHVLLEVGTYFRAGSYVLAGVRLQGGVHHTSAGMIAREFEQCQMRSGCSLRSPVYRSGWSAIVGVGGELRAHLNSVLTSYSTLGLQRLVAGANSGETFPVLSVGMSHRL